MRLSGKSGKAVTFILVVFLVLLISATGISLFFFLKESEMRQAAETKVGQLQAVEAKLNAELKSAKDQITLLEGKRKDAEEMIENLRQEVDLQKNAKEELKNQNTALQENLQKEVQAKEDVRSRLNQDLQAAQEKYNAIKSELDKVVARNKELEAAKAQVQDAATDATNPTGQASGVELGKIVVNTEIKTKGKGKVISVDSDTDFVIVSLGEKDGVSKGTVLSVFRGDQYLGDVKVSRVLAEMAAADFVPPFKSQSVKKDDQVIIKK